MKIGIDIRSLNTSSYGGVNEYIKNLLPALFNAGHRHSFHLFINAYKGSGLENDFSNLGNVKLHKFSYPNKFLTFTCRYLKWPKIDKLLGGVDVFFSPHFIPAPVSTGTRKIITFHDLSFEQFPEYFDRRRRLWHRYMSPKTQARSANGIIAVSNSTKEDLENFYNVPPEKIEVVYSGICDSVTSPPPMRWSNIKKKYKLKGDYILSLSTIEPRKNIVALIRAFNALQAEGAFSDVNLVIAGATGWKYKKILKEAETSVYKNKILFIGPVKEEEKYILYKNSKIFVYPSLYEGFGFPPLEAMHSGTPVIVSSVTSLPEITKGAAVLINPYIPRDITRAISELLSDRQFAHHVSATGKKVASEFTWEKTAKETLRVLEGK